MTCPGCDEDAYEEFIDELYPEVRIGALAFSPGRILKEMDPIAFRCGMSEYECKCKEEKI